MPDGLGVFACGLGGEDGRTLVACAAPDFHEEAAQGGARGGAAQRPPSTSRARACRSQSAAMSGSTRVTASSISWPSDSAPSASAQQRAASSCAAVNAAVVTRSW